MYHFGFHSLALGSVMLDAEFKRQRAQTVRELSQKATDPFIKARLVKLIARYEDSVVNRASLAPVDLKSQRQGTGSER